MGSRESTAGESWREWSGELAGESVVLRREFGNVCEVGFSPVFVV